MFGTPNFVRPVRPTFSKSPNFPHWPRPYPLMSYTHAYLYSPFCTPSPPFITFSIFHTLPFHSFSLPSLAIYPLSLRFCFPLFSLFVNSNFFSSNYLSNPITIFNNSHFFYFPFPFLKSYLFKNRFILPFLLPSARKLLLVKGEKWSKTSSHIQWQTIHSDAGCKSKISGEHVVRIGQILPTGKITSSTNRIWEKIF